MRVLKFGWTSLKDLEMINRTTDIVLEAKKEEEVLVVVSAMSKVTDTLIELCNLAEKWETTKIAEWLKLLKKKHYDVVKWLYTENPEKVWEENVQRSFEELEYIIKWVSFLNSKISDKDRAKILYFWEILSSILVSLSIRKRWTKSRSQLSRDFLICSWCYLDWDCDKKASDECVTKIIWDIDLSEEIPIVTGFWGGDLSWDIYLFNRWWSDYVATLVGRHLNASSVEIWTDVSWVMSADPRIVENPIIWKELNYTVAAEFALVWAKVLHPKTISPVQEYGIPIFIKNTFAPKDYGTKISNIKDRWIKGISIDDNQIVLTFIDPSMLGTFGYINKVSKILNENNISIDTMATTETSFSMTISKNSYSEELVEKLACLKPYLKLKVDDNVSKIALVGDSIDSYKVFEHLKDVILVSQWAFQKSLTVFVKRWDSKELLKTLHMDVFWK